MKLSFFPQIKVVHTSKIFHGQLYVPMMNWLLMTGTVLVAAIFNNVRFPIVLQSLRDLTKAV
jgi:KUP system potassium uptake protein